MLLIFGLATFRFDSLLVAALLLTFLRPARRSLRIFLNVSSQKYSALVSQHKRFILFGDRSVHLVMLDDQTH